MDENDAVDESNATVEGEEGVSILHFSAIWCFLVILLICFQNSAGSAVAVISVDFAQKNLFFLVLSTSDKC